MRARKRAESGGDGREDVAGVARLAPAFAGRGADRDGRGAAGSAKEQRRPLAADLPARKASEGDTVLRRRMARAGVAAVAGGYEEQGDDDQERAGHGATPMSSVPVRPASRRAVSAAASSAISCEYTLHFCATS